MNNNLPYAQIEETNIYAMPAFSQFGMTQQIIRMNINDFTSVKNSTFSHSLRSMKVSLGGSQSVSKPPIDDWIL